MLRSKPLTQNLKLIPPTRKGRRRKKSFLFWAINKKEGIAFDPALNSYVSRCVAGEDFHTEMDNWNFSNRYSASFTGTSAYMCFD